LYKYNFREQDWLPLHLFRLMVPMNKNMRAFLLLELLLLIRWKDCMTREQKKLLHLKATRVE
jgi:hypothetical protein